MTRLADILRDHFGLMAGAIGMRSLEGAARERMKSLGLNSLSHYADLLTAQSAERQCLIELIVVPETWFFRYPESFTQLQSLVLARNPLQPFRVLCLPCSTGEEAYSVAMVLHSLGLRESQFQILAGDVSQNSLDLARAGVYRPGALRELGADAKKWQAKHLQIQGDKVHVSAELKSAIRWQQLNILDDNLLSSEAPFDVIFCRNLFIYLSDAARKSSLAKFARMLKSAGSLFVGHAEPLGFIDPRFQSVGPPQAFQFRMVEAVRKASPISEAVPKTPPPLDAPNVAKRDPLQEARTEMDAGRVEVALPLLKALLTSLPTAEVYTLIGVAEMMQNRSAEAERAFTQALYIDPKHYDALMPMLTLAEGRGDAISAANYRRRLRLSEAKS
jgi:chemotaxis protein methyltransferase WspC